MGRLALLMVALGASACPQRDAGAGATTSTSSTDTKSRTSTSAPTATTRVSSGPLRADVRAIVLADGIGISVRALEAMELAPAVQLIAEGAEPSTVLTLRLDCRSQGCVSLAPGAELLAPSWIERPEGERCDAAFRPQRAGEYRLRVQSCDGTRQLETSVRWNAP